ncbi:CLUMA_CG002603, isoform A [Clunio marinus]|uniref:asparaginase n=1 Tax=Clunio marinus TaxID=568069 RepID=A0A1J1HLN0_9DIPT|nr:CLUMA_CG002603, isoform A [Clunio marinus]
MSNNNFDQTSNTNAVSGNLSKQESVMSIYEPTPMSPTKSNSGSNGSLLKPPSLNTPDNSIENPITRKFSYGNLGNQAEARVLVLFTGGTIGMMRNDKNVLEPIANQLLKRMRKYPHMHDEEYASKRFGKSSLMAPLVLPHVEGEHRRIIYTISEYEPLLDSSNMTFQDWMKIAEDIMQSYEFFDGFVVLHGTDTLSYTASALSFMLENLGKTVIITGSQIPIFETRSDGKDNFMGSLIIAGNYVIPEVCVLFNSKLFRGNRTIKISSASLDAFDSPNVSPIAKLGLSAEVDYRLIFRPCKVAKFTVHSKLDENVGILRIFPNMPTQTIKAFLQPPMKGVVLQTFGSGNIPNNRRDLHETLREATDRGIIIVNCTQCITGSVAEIYETGRQLLDCGVIPGFDMTPEAALAKLSYVLGKDDWNLNTKKVMMQNNLRGELTNGKAPQLDDYDLVDAVARSLHLSTPKELEQLGAVLFPAMVNASVVSGDTKKIDMLKSYGANLSAINYDLRTALHVACAEGNEDVVKHLLLNGAAVHIRDRYDRSPLFEAINHDHHEIIKLLLKCGSHVTGSTRGLGDSLCGAAARGLIKRLESYRLAGVDLSLQDTSGRTALHLAALHGHVNVIDYLLNHEVEFTNDLLGLTPLDYAKKGNNLSIITKLESKIPHLNGNSD